jgi:hypothetical protein
VKALPAIVLLAAAFVGHPAAARGGAAPAWRVACVAGRDEYASNCLATWAGRGLTLTLSTGDSQLFLQVEASHCRGSPSAEQNNWFRLDLEGLPAARRRAIVRGAMDDAMRKLRARCRDLRTAPPMSLPDLVTHGEP